MAEVDDLREENERLKRELEETREDLRGLLPLARNAEHEKDIAAMNEALHRLTGRFAYFRSLADKYENRAEYLAEALEQIVAASEKGSATEAIQEMLGIAEGALKGTSEETGIDLKAENERLKRELDAARDDLSCRVDPGAVVMHPNEHARLKQAEKRGDRLESACYGFVGDVGRAVRYVRDEPDTTVAILVEAIKDLRWVLLGEESPNPDLFDASP